MSGSKTATGQGDHLEDDCPLCLEPLPPFWDADRRSTFICCEKAICNDCLDSKSSFLHKAVITNAVGRGELQLATCCPLCRTDEETAAKVALEKYEKDELSLGLFYDLGCFQQDIALRMDIWRRGAEKGNPACQYLIGNCYREGSDGLRKSHVLAKRWFLAAAKQGHASAEFNLALMLKNEGNSAEYLRHIKSSASKGDDEACYLLGLAYSNGEDGLEKSTEDAIRVLTPAAQRGHTGCMGVLGCVMITPHQPLPGEAYQHNPNYQRGVQWYMQAAEKGDQRAIQALRMIARPVILGTPIFTRKMHWLRRTAQAGKATSIALLGSYEKEAGSTCFRCEKKAPPDEIFLRCSRCRAAWYCSKDCQVQHWTAEGGHKQCCIKWESS